ncbi:MAG: hypothetical protein E7D32_10420, partial [Staphylococcus epidermidis]|nr:hypothetical protein [Staphylococcus epidermidis]
DTLLTLSLSALSPPPIATIAELLSSIVNSWPPSISKVAPVHKYFYFPSPTLYDAVILYLGGAWLTSADPS